MKTALVILMVLAIAGISYVLISPADNATDSVSDGSDAADRNDLESMEGKSQPAPGTYTLRTDRSVVNWAGKKPFIDGYVNSGAIAITSGSILIGEESATGEFTIDMNTLSVSATPAKPGSESALESHLKGERWFNVAANPEATFVIDEVSPRPESPDTHVYDVTGELTLNGKSNTVTFPATIYQDSNNVLTASADFEIDRTRWGITSSSDSFFDNLADNVVDDMVNLSFTLIADKTMPDLESDNDSNDITSPSGNDVIIGMTEAEARTYAEQNGTPFRVGSKDGEPFALTMDYRPGRITAAVENNVVVSYTVE